MTKSVSSLLDTVATVLHDRVKVIVLFMLCCVFDLVDLFVVFSLKFQLLNQDD